MTDICTVIKGVSEKRNPTLMFYNSNQIDQFLADLFSV